MFIGIDVNGAVSTPTLSEVAALSTSCTSFAYDTQVSCLFSGVGAVNETVSGFLGFPVLGDAVFVSYSGSKLTPLPVDETEKLGLALFSSAVTHIEKMSPLLFRVS